MSKLTDGDDVNEAFDQSDQENDDSDSGPHTLRLRSLLAVMTYLDRDTLVRLDLPLQIYLSSRSDTSDLTEPSI